MGAWIAVAALVWGHLSADVALPCRGDDRAPAIHLRIDQDGQLAPAELRIAVAEVERIWAANGVTVTWGRYGDPVEDGARVVSIRLVQWLERKNGKPVLGWAPGAGERTGTPIVFASMQAVMDHLLTSGSVRGKPFNALPLGYRRQLLAVAIGRVVAHELGHQFVTGRDHDKRGLMRPHYRTGDLVDPLPANVDILAGRPLTQLPRAARPCPSRVPYAGVAERRLGETDWDCSDLSAVSCRLKAVS